jgi:hypothetical protein
MKDFNFDRNEHIYTRTAFAELVKDAVRFFNGTPVHTLPPPEAFGGAGVYALYYTGQHDPGKGRCEQAKSDWDVIHPGRAWAEKCKGAHSSDTTIFARVNVHLNQLVSQS